MMKGKWPLAVLLAAVLLMVALRGVIIQSKPTWLQDEGGALIGITDHANEYDRVMYDSAYPARAWARAAQWKKFFTLDHPVTFREISAALASSDFHPPLYYWICYQWYRVFGLDPWTGSWLCVMIAVLLAAALFGFAAEVPGDRGDAAAVAFTWAVSPAVIVISEQSRQYELLGLCAVLMVWRTVHAADRQKPLKFRDLASLVVIAAAGMLTHYHFALVLSGCMVYVFFNLVRADRRRAAALLAALAVGAAGLPVFHPGFYHSFQRGLAKERGFEIMERGLDKAAGFTLGEGVGRIIHIVRSLAGFFLDPVAFREMLPRGATVLTGCWIVLLLLLALGIVWPRFRRASAPAAQAGKAREDRGGRVIAFFLAWIGGWTAVLYVACISPSQAMGARYLAAVWPFFAFLPVLFFRRFTARRRLITALFCLGLLISGGLTAADKRHQSAGAADLKSVHFDQLLLDSLSRTQVPSAIYLTPDNAQVFAAYQDFLLAHPEAWVDQLQGKVVYVSRYGFGGNSPDKTRQILDLIRQRRRIASISSFGPGGFVMDIN